MFSAFSLYQLIIEKEDRPIDLCFALGAWKRFRVWFSADWVEIRDVATRETSGWYVDEVVNRNSAITTNCIIIDDMLAVRANGNLCFG